MSPLSESISSQIAQLEEQATRGAAARTAVDALVDVLAKTGLLPTPPKTPELEWFGVAGGEWRRRAIEAEAKLAAAENGAVPDWLRADLLSMCGPAVPAELAGKKPDDMMLPEVLSWAKLTHKLLHESNAALAAPAMERAMAPSKELLKAQKRIHELDSDIEAANESMGALFKALVGADRLEQKETEKKGDGLAEHIDLVHHVVEGMLEDLGVAGDMDDGDPDDAPAAPRKKAKKGYAEIQIRMFIENLVRRGDGEATAKEKADSRKRLEGASFDGIDPQIVTMAARAITGDLKDAEWRKFDEEWEDAAIAKEKAAVVASEASVNSNPFVIMRTVPKLGKQLFVNGEDRWVLATDADHATKWPTALDAEAVKKAMNLRRTKVIALAELGPAPIVELHADAGDEGGFVVTASLERGRRCFALVGPGMTGLTTYHKVLEDEVAVAEFEHLEEAKSRARELAKLLGYRTAVWDVGRLVKEEERTQEDGSLAEAVAE